MNTTCFQLVIAYCTRTMVSRRTAAGPTQGTRPANRPDAQRVAAVVLVAVGGGVRAHHAAARERVRRRERRPCCKIGYR